MRLYKTTFIDDEKGEGVTCATWSGTQTDAGKDRKSMKQQGMRNVATEEVDVPTDKQGLLAFLNQWAVQA